MVATAETARLTEAHRLAQARLGAQTVRQALTSWSLLDPTDLDRTLALWLRVTVPVVQSQRSRSALLAANYMRAFRLLAAGDLEGFTATLDTAADVRALTTSLMVTGPVQLKAAMARGVALEAATATAQVTNARSAMRYALNGGRETVLNTVRADTRSRGWRRVTSGKPCPFCSMLAGRGHVYTSATVQFHSHDGCACAAEPVYR